MVSLPAKRRGAVGLFPYRASFRALKRQLGESASPEGLIDPRSARAAVP